MPVYEEAELMYKLLTASLVRLMNLSRSARNEREKKRANAVMNYELTVFRSEQNIKIMTQEEYNNIDWHRGNYVRLTNGKEYKVSLVKKNGHLILKSVEYLTHFLVCPNIIVERTSDAIDTSVKTRTLPSAAEAQPKVKEPKPVISAQPKPAADVQPKEGKEMDVAKDATENAETPKRKRTRVRIQTHKYVKASEFKSKK